jgi:putative lipoic acid-binding regulatory protein
VTDTPLPTRRGSVVATAYEAVTAMTQPDVKSHKIEFPCADYPIKVVGDSGANYKDMVIEVLSKYAKVDLSTLAERQSTNGKYTTVQLHIEATGEDQLRDINSALRATGIVHMVL